MRMAELTADLKRILHELELAQLTSALMAGVRLVHESDEETLRRVIEEYKYYKYSKLRADQRELVKEAQRRAPSSTSASKRCGVSSRSRIPTWTILIQMKTEYQKLHDAYLINQFLEVLTEDEEDELLGQLDHLWWGMTDEEHEEIEADSWKWNRVLVGAWAHIEPAGVEDE